MVHFSVQNPLDGKMFKQTKQKPPASGTSWSVKLLGNVLDCQVWHSQCSDEPQWTIPALPWRSIELWQGPGLKSPWKHLDLQKLHFLHFGHRHWGSVTDVQDSGPSWYRPKFMNSTIRFCHVFGTSKQIPLEMGLVLGSWHDRRKQLVNLTIRWSCRWGVFNPRGVCAKVLLRWVCAGHENDFA